MTKPTDRKRTAERERNRQLAKDYPKLYAAFAAQEAAETACQANDASRRHRQPATGGVTKTRAGEQQQGQNR